MVRRKNMFSSLLDFMGLSFLSEKPPTSDELYFNRMEDAYFKKRQQEDMAESVKPLTELEKNKCS
jgi:hypothetical protein